MPFNLHWPELLLILAIVILLFGFGRLSRISREIAHGIRGFRAGLSGAQPPAPKDEPR
jgi:sec-independent protein translocase protein TatA